MAEVLKSLPFEVYATVWVFIICLFRFMTARLIVKHSKSLSDKQVAYISNMTSKVIGINFPNKSN